MFGRLSSLFSVFLSLAAVLAGTSACQTTNVLARNPDSRLVTCYLRSTSRASTVAGAPAVRVPGFGGPSEVRTRSMTIRHCRRQGGEWYE